MAQAASCYARGFVLANPGVTHARTVAGRPPPRCLSPCSRHGVAAQDIAATTHPRRGAGGRSAAARARAGQPTLGYEITESLTTEVGPRLAGSEADARAVAWAQAKFKALGFDRVWLEPVTFPKWERRSESRAGAGRQRAAADLDRAGRQPGRHGRGRGRALRRPGRAGSRARRFAGRQDRLRRLPDGARTRRQRLRPGLARAQRAARRRRSAPAPPVS